MNGPDRIDAPERFETERLVATRLAASDLESICRLESDPLTQAPLFGVRTRAETVARTARALAAWDERGYGTWAVRTKAGAFAGIVLLFSSRVEGETGNELGYALLPEFWGRGFATEISQAALDVAFEHLKFPYVLAVTFADNAPSRRVIEKLGMSLSREVSDPEKKPIVHYRIERDRWLATRGSHRKG